LGREFQSKKPKRKQQKKENGNSQEGDYKDSSWCGETHNQERGNLPRSEKALGMGKSKKTEGGPGGTLEKGKWLQGKRENLPANTT